MHGLIGRSERRDEIHITHLGSEDVGASLLKPWRWGSVDGPEVCFFRNPYFRLGMDFLCWYCGMALRNARNNNVGGLEPDDRICVFTAMDFPDQEDVHVQRK